MMRERKMNSTLIHAIAHCLDCGKEFDCFKDGGKQARKHAKDFKHIVSGERAYSFKYNGKEKGR